MDSYSNLYKIDGLNVRFESLNVTEGIKISNALLSSIRQNDIDLSKFSKESLAFICSKMEVETKDSDNNMSFKKVQNIESLSYFFKNPLVSIEVVTCYISYLTPFLDSLKNLNTLKQTIK